MYSGRVTQKPEVKYFRNLYSKNKHGLFVVLSIN